MYLIHRITHEGDRARKLLGTKDDKTRLLSIGWGTLTGEEKKKLAEAAKQGREVYRIAVKEVGKEGLSGHRAWFLFNFLSLREGDTVIVPSPNEVSIYKVKGKPVSHIDTYDLGFVVEVESIEEGISRKDYITGELHKKLKFKGSNLVLHGDLKEDVEEVIDHYRKKIKVSNKVLQTKIKLIEVVQDYIENSLTDITFEKLIKEYFKNVGADKVTIPAKNVKMPSNEFIADVDVKAVFEKIKIMIYVQAKLHKGISNLDGVKQLVEYQVEKDEDSNNYQVIKWLINTGEVIENAENEPLDNGIRIIQGKEFAEMLVESGFNFNEESFN
ncbi:hypothetical protein ERX35_007605 [Macrococcus equipercicus]|uniref:Restriction endonuclease type IV Mrr domain-containing protein n=1 Tax=Macrococcus equipercicus TaxID=69967 RepID=A0ABQ6R7K4_9STAP|nr:restriction endonuclease [Macrococcus equipercicus]KAA1039071.1 hypothetical protein ERX35_007605 [Macrococcus equipercicus]